MDDSTLKLILSKDNWLIITIILLYFAFKIVMFFLENKKAKTKEELLVSQYTEIKNSISNIGQIAKNSTEKDRILDSINQKLKIIYAQYGCELSKELAMIVINNVYFTFATLISNEFYELQKQGHSYEKIISNMRNKISIINDEKIQELDGFIYRDKHLITFTSGQIVDPEKIIKIIQGYSEKNGLLRNEMENLLGMEAKIIIKRL